MRDKVHLTMIEMNSFPGKVTDDIETVGKSEEEQYNCPVHSQASSTSQVEDFLCLINHTRRPKVTVTIWASVIV